MDHTPTQPQSFRDTKGRSWNLQLSVGGNARVLAMTGIDLHAVYSDPRVLARIASPPYIDLCNVLFAVCKPQADAAGVSDVEFGESLGGESLQAAIAAFREALASFPENPEVRAAFRKLIQAQDRVARRVGSTLLSRISDDAVERQLQAIEQKAVEEADRLMNRPLQTSGVSSGESAGS